MAEIIKCAVFLAVLGSMSFFIGRLIPRRWFRPGAFPYRSFEFEKNGRIYEKIGIKKWKDKLPDMSRILPALIPAKHVQNNFDGNTAELMLKETCTAEFIHAAIAVLGILCIPIAGVTGTVIWLLWAAGNVPFILVQRYNRPRLARLCRVRERVYNRASGKGESMNEDPDFELQYRGRT